MPFKKFPAFGKKPKQMIAPEVPEPPDDSGLPERVGTDDIKKKAKRKAVSNLIRKYSS